MCARSCRRSESPPAISLVSGTYFQISGVLAAGSLVVLASCAQQTGKRSASGTYLPPPLSFSRRYQEGKNKWFFSKLRF